MHQYNGLFDVNSPECQKATIAVETSPDSTSLSARTTSNPPNGDAATAEWSSAVGHATTGKSGRVIHNLQEEIARLTRECSVYRSRAEETQRMNDAFKMQVQNMTERLRNLEHANETNLQSIRRKDKKIEELRAEVQSEKERRRRAEGETDKFQQLMNEARDEFNRKCAELQEIANHSRTQYDVLAKAGQRERADQQRKLKAIRDDFLALKAEHEKRDVHLERLDTVISQKNREIEIGRERFDQLFEDYEAYKKAHDEEVRALIERNYQGAANIDSALASLKETEEKMKWAIQVKNKIKDAQ
ncbi:mother-specific HO expression [Aspergillus fumigatus]